MLLYNIGNAAIRANQLALQTVSNNIANADTEGYRRQRVDLVENKPLRQGSLFVGTGVEVQGISRVVDTATDQAITLNLSLASRAQVQLESLQSIEALLTPNSGSLQNSVTEFFDRAEMLAGSPTDSARQLELVSAAKKVAQQITTYHQGLDQLQRQTGEKIQEAVNQVNTLVEQIGSLERQIKTVEASGGSAPTLLNERDLLVQRLGQLVDLSPASLSDPDGTLVAAGGWLVVIEQASRLSVRTNSDGTHSVLIGNSETPIQPVSGKLAGLLETSQQMVPSARKLMQEWASVFVSGVNSVQATGLSAAGPTSLMSTNVGNVDSAVPLANSNSLLPIGEGELTITMTNVATGERETKTISISPTTDSLQDVIAQLDAIPHLRASLSANGQLVIAAEPGHLFDFAGRPSSHVDTSSITGTATPSVGGVYNGSANANWTLTASSNGQIGVTSGLKLIVTDSLTGQVFKELNVGAGYPIGQPLGIADGFSITMGNGSLVAGDSFDVTGISDPDSAGFLAAFGIGGLFQTTDLRTLTVNQQVASNPKLIATGRTGELGDASRMNQLVALRDARILANGTETIEGRLATLTSNIGVDVNQQTSVVEHLQAQYEQLRNRQDSVSGVDPNEELLAMLQFQRSFQANARFLSSVNSALDDLLGLLR